VDDLVQLLRLLKVWAGDPSYSTITERVNAAWTAAGRPATERTRRSTVADCFRLGRRRLNFDLVVAVVWMLHPDRWYVTQWRQALRVVGGEVRAVSQVRVQDVLPRELVGFTGRESELGRLGEVLDDCRRPGAPVVISAIEGMAGVGKTQLAIQAAHLLGRERPFDGVLFVNLRGFHPDPVQPPADPAAVLDGFLRLLGVSTQQIPHDLESRRSAYRDRLSGTRTLILLDNAVDEDQVRPLLPETPGCPVLVTSRRSLDGLDAASRLTLDVFTAAEAVAFLADALPGVPIGPDPGAPRRIAHRCGHLPLALGLVAGHIRATRAWTLTDHADRLDERHADRRLDSAVELAFDLSYHHLPEDERRLLRLAALHPGQDLEIYAAAALAGTGLRSTRAAMRRLCRDHLVQQVGDRFAFHDLVRDFAAVRAGDDDSPPQRRKALIRLSDFHLVAAAGAMDALHPYEADRRPRIDSPSTPLPDLSDPAIAQGWLDTERPTVTALTALAARDGRLDYPVMMSGTLFRYLVAGHHADALIVHGHARQATQIAGDSVGEANTLIYLGAALVALGRLAAAVEHFRQALPLYREAGDRLGEARAFGNLGLVAEKQSRYPAAVEYSERAFARYQEVGDRIGEARALGNVGMIEGRLGRYQVAVEHLAGALALFRGAGDRLGEAITLNDLGEVEMHMGTYETAGEHLQQSLALSRQIDYTDGQARSLNNLGALHTRLGAPDQALVRHRDALGILRATGSRDTEPAALNGLGEAANAAGDPRAALTHHLEASVLATAVGLQDEQARAQAGLGRAHAALGDESAGARHRKRAHKLYRDLGLPDVTPQV
ncbi:MAG: tetratricopeptide repeat protein, partial [Nocardioides sp.]